ncbi:cytochrome b-c1 complex subunit 8 [Thamnocephalis sphaerospora]|uniref:Cytochrome b-c1 complex subunit 8 n=1 Tax=Thamnocephalis sphaerospora TaxID=78915 RepID=A0A4P9XLK1_9FUNG|nr:cytochrome b-c1 complex subunit 8 [Thamnocephalis sphaerospora]|eukprot:RKP06743.1 cytochrome b-c1 complex subunit 8 [Thamnocephalis sphaerospora]
MGSGSGPLQRGIVTYQVSGFQQRAFANAIRKGVFNSYRRFASQLPYVVPGALLFYYTVKLGNERHAYLNSKAGAHLL